jgi:hypothetical protein
VLNLETNIVVESRDMTFDENAPCPHDVFKSEGDKEMGESIFVDEKLQCFEVNEDVLLLHQLHHLGLFLPPHMKHRLLKLLPLPQQEYRHQGLKGRSTLRMEPHPTFRRHIHVHKS